MDRIEVNMLRPKKYIGGNSNLVPAQLLPGIKSPSIMVFSKKNSLCLWNPKTKTNLALLEEISKTSSSITMIKMSRVPNSNEILISSGLSSGKILIWKLNLSKISIKFSWYIGHSHEISCIQISNESFRILSGCSTGSIVLWDFYENRGIFRNKLAHNGEIRSLEFYTPKNDQNLFIISYGKDYILKIWNSETGRCMKIIDMGIENFLQIKVQKKKEILLALSKEGKILIFKITNPFNLKYFGKFQSKKICYNPTLLWDVNESIFILNNGLGLVYIFISKKPRVSLKNNPENIKKLDKMQEIYSKIVSYNFRDKTNGLSMWKGKNKGNWIILSHDLNKYVLDFFNLSFRKNSKGRLEISMKRIFKRKIDSHLGEIRNVLWFLKDKFLITFCNSINLIYIWNLSLQKCVKKFSVRSSFISVEYFDDKSIFIGGIKGNIDLYEISSGKLIFSETNAHEGPIWSIKCAENSYYLATGSSDKFLKIWELENNLITLAKKLKVQEQILNIELIAGKNLVILSGISSVIWVFSFDSLEFRFSLQGHSLPIVSSSLCDNKKLLATSSADLSLRIWDIFEKTQKKVLFPENVVITSTIFQPYSTNFVSASKKGNVILWSGHTFAQICQFNGYHFGPIWTLKFSENGNFLATGSADQNVIIWKLDATKLQSKRSSDINQDSFCSKTVFSLQSGQKKFNKFLKKFHSILKILCQLRKKNKQSKEVKQLRGYLKNLFFEINPKHIGKIFKSLKNSELMIFLNILIDKQKNFVDLSFFSCFPEIFETIVNIEKNETNFKKQKNILYLKNKILFILKFEKLTVKKIANQFRVGKKKEKPFSP